MRPFRLGQKAWEKVTVVKRYDERSYEVETDTRSYRRNRVDLKQQQPTPQMSTVISEPAPDTIMNQDPTTTKPNNEIKNKSIDQPAPGTTAGHTQYCLAMLQEDLKKPRVFKGLCSLGTRKDNCLDIINRTCRILLIDFDWFYADLYSWTLIDTHFIVWDIVISSSVLNSLQAKGREMLRNVQVPINTIIVPWVTGTWSTY